MFAISDTVYHSYSKIIHNCIQRGLVCAAVPGRYCFLVWRCPFSDSCTEYDKNTDLKRVFIETIVNNNI